MKEVKTSCTLVWQEKCKIALWEKKFWCHRSNMALMEYIYSTVTAARSFLLQLLLLCNIMFAALKLEINPASFLMDYIYANYSSSNYIQCARRPQKVKKVSEREDLHSSLIKACINARGDILIRALEAPCYSFLSPLPFSEAGNCNERKQKSLKIPPCHSIQVCIN